MKKEKLMNNILQGLLMATVVVAALPFPDLAFAQDLNANITKLTTQELTNIPDIIAAGFYIGGAAFVGTGILKLKQHAENPGQVKMGEGLGRLGAGAALSVSPLLAQTLVSTFSYGNTAVSYTKYNTVQ